MKIKNTVYKNSVKNTILSKLLLVLYSVNGQKASKVYFAYSNQPYFNQPIPQVINNTQQNKTIRPVIKFSYNNREEIKSTSNVSNKSSQIWMENIDISSKQMEKQRFETVFSDVKRQFFNTTISQDTIKQKNIQTSDHVKRKGITIVSNKMEILIKKQAEELKKANYIIQMNDRQTQLQNKKIEEQKDKLEQLSIYNKINKDKELFYTPIIDKQHNSIRDYQKEQVIMSQKIQELEGQVNQNVVTIKDLISENKTLINMHNDVVDKYDRLKGHLLESGEENIQLENQYEKLAIEYNNLLYQYNESQKNEYDTYDNTKETNINMSNSI